MNTSPVAITLWAEARELERYTANGSTGLLQVEPPHRLPEVGQEARVRPKESTTAKGKAVADVVGVVTDIDIRHRGVCMVRLR